MNTLVSASTRSMAAAISRCAGREVKPGILTASGPPASSASAQDDVVAGCACWCEVGDTVCRYHTTPGTEKVERQLKFPVALRPMHHHYGTAAIMVAADIVPIPRAESDTPALRATGNGRAACRTGAHSPSRRTQSLASAGCAG